MSVVDPSPFPANLERPRAALATREAWAFAALAVVSGLCGWLIHPNGYAWLAATLLAATIGMAWPWITVAGLRASLHVADDRIADGEAISFRLVVRNRWPWTAWDVRVAIHIQSRTVSVALPPVGGRAQQTISWSTEPSRRGIYPSTPARLVCQFPFGLFSAARAIDTERVTVWPRIYPVERTFNTSPTRAGEESSALHIAGNTGERAAVRAFRPGDSLRAVHWIQTARHDHLVTRETLSPPVEPLQLALCCSRSESNNADIEAAISAFASIASAWTARGRRFHAHVDGRQYPINSPIHCSALLDLLATYEPRDGARADLPNTKSVCVTAGLLEIAQLAESSATLIVIGASASTNAPVHSLESEQLAAFLAGQEVCHVVERN